MAAIHFLHAYDEYPLTVCGLNVDVPGFPAGDGASARPPLHWLHEGSGMRPCTTCWGPLAAYSPSLAKHLGCDAWEAVAP